MSSCLKLVPKFTSFPSYIIRSSVFGLEPIYSKVNSGFKTFLHDQAFHFKYNDGVIPELQVAYETWGMLNEAKDNVVLLCTGLSASSHAKSHTVRLTYVIMESVQLEITAQSLIQYKYTFISDNGLQLKNKIHIFAPGIVL